MWRDISTAPRDGRFVLLYGGEVNESCDDFFFYHEKNRIVVGKLLEGTFEDSWVISGYDLFCTIRYDNPTHWMPLPEPPNE